MTEAEKIKNTLSSIFRRKGADGRYTRLFDNLEPAQKDALLKEVLLCVGELPVIGSAESAEKWLILTTERIVWRLKGKTQSVDVHDVWHATIDGLRMIATGVRKHQLRELQLETARHERHTIEVEEGPPLFGVWNALLNLAARTRRTEKDQSKSAG